jgi:hypothetical protein
MTNLEDDLIVRQMVATAVSERRDVRPDWSGVLRRAGVRQLPVTRRRIGIWRRSPRWAVSVAVGVLCALAASTLAVGAQQGWWFGQSNGPPTPAGSVATVAEGTWNGVPWALAAYQSSDGQTCYSMTPRPSENPRGVGAAVSCNTFGAGPDSSQADMGALATGATADFPAYIVGPVSSTAVSVRIELADGRSVSTDTIAAPNVTPGVGFFVARLPCGVGLARAVGEDANGHTVATMDLRAFLLERGVDTACS